MACVVPALLFSKIEASTLRAPLLNTAAPVLLAVQPEKVVLCTCTAELVSP
jgi:hypothetical protein